MKTINVIMGKRQTGRTKELINKYVNEYLNNKNSYFMLPLSGDIDMVLDCIKENLHDVPDGMKIYDDIITNVTKIESIYKIVKFLDAAYNGEEVSVYIDDIDQLSTVYTLDMVRAIINAPTNKVTGITCTVLE